MSQHLKSCSLPNAAGLTYVTLTGVDDSTDLIALGAFSRRHPLAEWGFLHSTKRQGLGGRYPSVSTIRQAFETLQPEVRVALHICGEGVPNLLAGEQTILGLVEAIAARNGRVQLNFSQRDDTLDLKALGATLARFPKVTFITQHNAANTDVWKALSGFQNHAVLFDSSGGRGVECAKWPAPLPKVQCGYAGGLGPDNLSEQLPRIHQAAQGAGFWVDMEGKLRMADVFDLVLASGCLLEAEAFLSTLE